MGLNRPGWASARDMNRKHVHLLTSVLGILATVGFVYGLYDLYQFSLSRPNVALWQLPWGSKAATFIGMGACGAIIAAAIAGSVRWMPERKPPSRPGSSEPPDELNP